MSLLSFFSKLPKAQKENATPSGAAAAMEVDSIVVTKRSVSSASGGTPVEPPSTPASGAAVSAVAASQATPASTAGRSESMLVSSVSARKRLRDDSDSDEVTPLKSAPPPKKKVSPTGAGRGAKKKPAKSLADSDSEEPYVPSDEGAAAMDEDDDEGAGGDKAFKKSLSVAATVRQRVSLDSPRSMPVGSVEDRRKAKVASFAEANEKRYAWLASPLDGQRRPPTDPDYDPSTLYVPAGAKMTAFEKQYWDIKKNLFDTVVFFKKGKFYEVFEGDADIAHQELDLKLTDRVNMRMAGVPENQFENWAARLIGLGYKVARVDQIETAVGAAIAKKEGTKGKNDSLIRRELTQVLTAGTLVDELLIGSAAATYIVAIAERRTADGNPDIGVAALDAGTARFMVCGFADSASYTALETILQQLRPKELLLETANVSPALRKLLKVVAPGAARSFLEPGSDFWDAAAGAEALAARFPEQDGGVPAGLTAALGMSAQVLPAVGGLISYLTRLRLDRELLAQRQFAVYEPLRATASLVLDGQTLANLEVLSNATDGTARGSLLELLNRCVTPFGRRMFVQWLCHPLAAIADIERRQGAVQALQSAPELAAALRAAMHRLPDLERLASRARAGGLTLEKLVTLLESLSALAAAWTALQPLVGSDGGPVSVVLQGLIRLESAGGRMPELGPALAEIRGLFDMATARQEGRIEPAAGLDAAFDELSAALARHRAALDAHLVELQGSMRLPGLVYRHINKETHQLVVKAGTKVPADWAVKSSTKTEARYWSPFVAATLPLLEEDEERFSQMQSTLLARLLARFAAHAPLWARAVETLSVLDGLMALAEVSTSLDEPKCFPRFVEQASRPDGRPLFDARGLRHPCVRLAASATYIANDTVLGADSGAAGAATGPICLMLTGPNMGGKSTLLRQTCVAVILAQLGCAVPAEALTLTPTDRIFTRIGAHDNIVLGQSTFLIELLETAAILKSATAASLVVLDELGRGTATFDGYAIAAAVLRYILDAIGCRTLFATHYHALCGEFAADPLVRLQHMACLVNDAAKSVTFLYRLTDGAAERSHGMHVAAMAGLPHDVVEEATAAAARLEAAAPMRREAAASAAAIHAIRGLLAAQSDDEMEAAVAAAGAVVAAWE